MSRKKLGGWLRKLAGDNPRARSQATEGIFTLWAEMHADAGSAEQGATSFSAALKEGLRSQRDSAEIIVQQLFERFLADRQEDQERYQRAQESGDFDLYLADDTFDMTQPMLALVLAHCGQAASPLQPRLLRLLDSPDRSTRDVAGKMLRGLGAIERSVIEDLFEAFCVGYNEWSDPRAGAIAAQALREQAVLDRVIASLDAADEKTRMASCRVLCEVGPAAVEAVPKLLRLAQRTKAPVLVAITLGKIGDGREVVVSTLLRMLDDQRNWVRERAISALSEVGAAPEIVVPALIRLLEGWEPPWEQRKIEWDPDSDDLEAAIDALADYGELAIAAQPAFERLLALKTLDGDHGPELRYQIQIALAKIRGEPPPYHWLTET